MKPGGRSAKVAVSCRLILLALVLAAGALYSRASGHAAWIWTPETGKWVNPKNQPRETPALQYQHAESLHTKGDYDKAIEEYKKIHKFYPESNYGDLTQFSIAVTYQADGEYKQAFEEFQKVIENYPGTELYDQVVARQYELAEHFLRGGMKENEGLNLFSNSHFDDAIEIYKKVLENQPFGETAAEAQYRIGLCHYQQKEYDEASFEYQEVVDEYPASKVTTAAAYGSAMCLYQKAEPAPYDQSAAEAAIAKFESFLRNYPDDERVPEARDKIKSLRELCAAHQFGIAAFYLENSYPDSAKLYLSALVDDYPETQWADKAREILATLQ